MNGGGINRQRRHNNRQNQQQPQTHAHTPILQLIAAPIGNLADITLRALESLRAADIIAAEDTRVARRLLSAHGISGKKIISARAHNEETAANNIIKTMQTNNYQNAVYLSDAGTPGISDPGARIAKRARAAGLTVSALPGASALTTILSAAGSRNAMVHFAGFPPRAKNQRKQFFLNLAALSGDIVIFESPRRIIDTCTLIKESFGENTRIVIGRELTKAHEQITDTTAAEIVQLLTDGTIPQRGEFTLYAETPTTKPPKTQTPETIHALLKNHLPPRTAATLTAKITNTKTNPLYKKSINK